MEHSELVPDLPQDMIALEWGHEADHPFDRDGALLAASGLPFYVCPGTSSWNSIAGRTENALGNLRSAAENGRRHGAIGYLTTDWGDYGHWQSLPTSYPGFAYGAALSWGYDANCDMGLVEALDVHAFRDPTGTMGRIAYDLGNTYRHAGIAIPGVSALFLLLQIAPEQFVEIWRGSGMEFPARAIPNRFLVLSVWAPEIQRLNAEGLHNALHYIDRVMEQLGKAQIQRPDADLIRREYSWAADMLRHACQRGLWLLGVARGEEDTTWRRTLAEEADRLITEFQAIWLARNRPGGFKESVARMETMRRDYD
ncbi:MAG: hypothetical protein M3220_07490 [Chloroflexota bacterium]|nr:hypothetical protein [Chloroflexota bacterium]